jgi:hypothetical protein
MKHTKTVDVPAKTETVVYKTTCDLCGNEIVRERFGAEEVEVRHKTGVAYPEGGAGEETSVDLCGACFEEKLIPWLRSQGAEPVTKEWEW